MARLFISYKREEQAYAFGLRQWLIDAQDWPPHEVFVDVDELHAGNVWADKIFREAEASEAMLFLASELSIKPDSFCYKELQRARGVTIAVTLGGLSPDDERLKSALPYGADARQITELDSQPTSAFEFISPIDGKHGVIALNRIEVESIGETLRNLGIAPNSFTWKATDEGPYRGLDALQEGDEALFFGRDREVRDCIRVLEQVRSSAADRAFVIHSPSGAGKSSLLRAGLWRRLRRHAAFSPLSIVRMRDGVLTNEEWGLAAGLAKPKANLLNLPLGALEERVVHDLPRLLSDFADADTSRAGARRTLLLGIDQAEEMFALATPREIDEQRCLFAALGEASKGLHVRLVLTVRDDSTDGMLERLAMFGIAQETVRMFRLNRMPPPRFKDVIEKPAHVAAAAGFPLQIDDALVTALADATAQNQGEFSDALPILALTLQRLVRKRRAPDGTIMANPEGAGRLVSDAVAEAAKEALEAAGSDEGALRRLMIPRLVTWDPRAGEGGAAKRRVASAAELFAGERASLRPLANALVDQRLLTRAGDNYEVSHEALLRVAPLGALILELRGKFLRADMLTMEARDWLNYERRSEWVARTGERLRDAQTLLEDVDFGPTLSAPGLGVSAYLAACAEKDREERELRERIERYELASLTADVQAQQQLREVEALAAAQGADRGNRDKIYISYSRRDAVISGRISDALMRAGFEVFLDRDDIAVGEDWRKRLEELIRQADKVVVLLSPDATSSIQVARDVETAAHYGKDIVPVLVRAVRAEQVPRDVAKLNFVFMRDETEIDRGMPVLLRALATNMAWVREHTRVNDMAVQWNTERNVAFLLRGEALTAAERWLAAQPTSAPPVTSLQKEFIEASRKAELRRRGRIQLYAVAVAGFLALISILAAYQWTVAERARVVAERARVVAESQRSEAERERAAAQELAAQLSASSQRIEELQEALRHVNADNPLLKQ
jgi:hypothetical protein